MAEKARAAYLPKMPSCVSVTAFLISLLVSVAILFKATSITVTDEYCSDRKIKWSPASPALRFAWTMFPSVDLFTKNGYFGTATDQVEAQWEKLLPQYPISVPRSRLSQLEAPLDAVYAHPARSEDAVFAMPAVFVQLHCLNLLRRHTRSDERDYSHLPSFQGGNATVKLRLDQCLERLRFAFLCDADTAMFGWDAKPGNPFEHGQPDFASLHKCPELEAISQWTDNHGLRSAGLRDMWWGGVRPDMM
jgi:hypothetical protein